MKVFEPGERVNPGAGVADVPHPTPKNITSRFAGNFTLAGVLPAVRLKLYPYRYQVWLCVAPLGLIRFAVCTTLVSPA